MNFNLDKKSTEPVYKQIMKIINKSIDDGEFNSEKRLPTERKLSLDFNVSRGTIKKVFSELEIQGKIRKIQGKGTFPTGQSMIEKREFVIDLIRKLIDDLISLNFNEKQIKNIMINELWNWFDNTQKVTVAFIDCTEELLGKSVRQISKKCNAQVTPFLIEDIRKDSSLLMNGYDFVVTTFMHYDEVKQIINNKYLNIEKVTLNLSDKTISQVAMIKKDDSIAVIYKSFEFSKNVNENIRSLIGKEASISFNILKESEEFLNNLDSVDVVILESGYINDNTYECLYSNSEFNEKTIITFEYEMDEGSLIHLSDEIKKYWIKSVE
ncbi:GntR family transcriptional regulator [Clostridium sp. BJN0001]|uniref:GntR family transcriptional regulator n=1 Tax=Clostridium sp. BJN0001 TaxID=2930219 RepID=UPI001FD5E9F8|nr:GntR family transcriptional regulator [Clostridium sp. BJN0001]